MQLLVAPRSSSCMHQRERFGAKKSVREYPKICRNMLPKQHLLFSRAFNPTVFFCPAIYVPAHIRQMFETLALYASDEHHFLRAALGS